MVAARRGALFTSLALGATACGGLVEIEPGASAGDSGLGAASGNGGCRTIEEAGECGHQVIHGPGIPCDVPLTSPPPNIDEVFIAVDCTSITRSSESSDGSSWGYAPGYRSIQIRGAACSALLNGARRVDVAYGCARLY